MSEMIFLDNEYPDISNIILEDETSLDSFFNEKQQRLLTTVFYSGAEIPINVPFIAGTNVGILSHVRHSGIAPDVFLSVDIVDNKEWWEKNIRFYLYWEIGKPPDIVIEIVSLIPEDELGSKLKEYADLRILFYVVYDPFQTVSQTPLHIFQRALNSYVPKDDAWFDRLNLGLTLWDGVFEGFHGTWLRWCDKSGNLIKTGDEIAAEKNLEISQKDAQIKKALLLAIEMGLKPKFSDEYLGIFSEISKIDDLKLLEAIASQIPQIYSIDELRKQWIMGNE